MSPRDRIALMDCGIAPGCGNVVLGHLENRMTSVQRWDCLVGGLPAVRTWPYRQAGFSPIDVMRIHAPAVTSRTASW